MPFLIDYSSYMQNSALYKGRRKVAYSQVELRLSFTSLLIMA